MVNHGLIHTDVTLVTLGSHSATESIKDYERYKKNHIKNIILFSFLFFAIIGSSLFFLLLPEPLVAFSLFYIISAPAILRILIIIFVELLDLRGVSKELNRLRGTVIWVK